MMLVLRGTLLRWDVVIHTFPARRPLLLRVEVPLMVRLVFFSLSLVSGIHRPTMNHVSMWVAAMLLVVATFMLLAVTTLTIATLRTTLWASIRSLRALLLLLLWALWPTDAHTLCPHTPHAIHTYSSHSRAIG